MVMGGTAAITTIETVRVDRKMGEEVAARAVITRKITSLPVMTGQRWLVGLVSIDRSH